MNIRLQRKSVWEWLVLFVLAMPFALAFFTELLGLPSALKYTVDIGWAVLLLGLLANRIRLPDRSAAGLLMLAFLFFALTPIGVLTHFQSPLYYLWGLRNNLRFFVFFFACICFLREERAAQCLGLLDLLLWINLPLVLYQFFTLDKEGIYFGDYLGGIFGMQVGCNGYMNIFLMIVVARSVLRYMNHQESLLRCGINCVIALLIAAISELKIFFLEFAAIVALASLITRFSFRKLWIILGGILGMLVAIRMIYVLFPAFDGWFRLDRIWDTITSEKGYTGYNDMNRMTAVSMSLDRFLLSPWEKLFGLGMGNCDHANFDFLVTPFYRANNKLNYSWFSSAMLVLETGLAGLVLYVLFFVVLYFAAHGRQRRKQADLLHCQLARIMALMCLVLILYNNSLRMESAYMIFFILSLPFLGRERKEDCPDRGSIPEIITREES